MAGLALLHPVQGDLLLAAEGRLLKGDGQPHPQALAPLGTGPCPAAAEAPAEEAAEDIPQVSEVEAAVEAPAEPAASRGVVGVHTGKTELVVPGPFVTVAEDLIGLVDLLEAALRLLVPGVQVRVVLLGQAPVRLLDLRVRGALLNAQDLVVVPFLISHSLSHPIYPGPGAPQVSQ